MSDGRGEALLLLAVLRDRADDVEALLPRARPAAFVDLALACDVHPTVHARLAERDRTEALGSEAATRLETLRNKCRVDNLLLLARLGQALDVLAEAGIVPVALKGVDVLHRFAVPFDERTLDDVDLLVGPDEFPRAVTALEAAGWTSPPEPERTHWLRSSFELPMISPGPVGVTFELHWDLGQRERYRVDTDGILERTVALEVEGRRVRRLEDHDFVAHLLVHHHQHYYDRRLKWALDLHRVLSSADLSWTTVASRLRSWQAAAAGAMALEHLRKLFPAWIPEEATAALPVAGWRRALTRPLRSDHPLDLFRHTRSRRVQLYLAAVLLESPFSLPGYLLHRGTRDRGPTPPALENR